METPGVGTVRMMVCEGSMCNPNLYLLEAKIPPISARLCGGDKDRFDVVAPIGEELAAQLRGLAHTAHTLSRIGWGDYRWTCSVCHNSRR